MSTKVKSQPWMRMAYQIFNGSNEELFNERSNHIAVEQMVGIMRTLLKGAALSEKQQNSFIKNIQLRIPHMKQFVWTNPIQLTRKQKCDALKNTKYSDVVRYYSSERDLRNCVDEATAEAFSKCESDAHAVAQLVAYLQNFNVTPVTETVVTPVTTGADETLRSNTIVTR